MCSQVCPALRKGLRGWHSHVVRRAVRVIAALMAALALQVLPCVLGKGCLQALGMRASHEMSEPETLNFTPPECLSMRRDAG